MNASKILEQLMQQAAGQSGGQSGNTGGRGGAGLDIKGVLGGLSRQLGGGGGASGQGGGSGVDVKSLLGGGALGLLLGSGSGRKAGGKAMKYGAIASVGMMAWKAWQNAQDSSRDDSRDDSRDPSGATARVNARDPSGATARGPGSEASAEGAPVERLGGQALEERSLELLQAVIMAARADGHIDDQERELISGQIDALGADQELHAWVERQLKAPLDASALAARVDSPQAAREMYLISVAVVDEQHPMERAWLDQLGQALALPAEVVTELERQAREAD
ncbi:tellurite resistance TerB family protein [Halomonas sp. RA08-2]|uniref:tellurite resistance TerB family protein n=1 Tax=Halomonas sp. RA08-2 TaxID=3440842 RepID=UPI003EE92667